MSSEPQQRITHYDTMCWAATEVLAAWEIATSNVSTLEDSREALDDAMNTLRWAVNGDADE